MGDALLDAAAPAPTASGSTRSTLEAALTPQQTAKAAQATQTAGGPARDPGDFATVVAAQLGAEFQITGLSRFDASLNRFTLEQFQQTLRSGMFVEQLNQLRDQLREQFSLDKTVSISVAGVSLGVSVAYVLWMVRGGVLLGSYLSAIPAWRLLDPLPVLGHLGTPDADEDDDDTFDPGAGKGGDPLRGFS
jgi:hypothetical protein